MWLFLQSVVIIWISLLPVISVNTCACADHRGLIVNRWLETYSRYLQPLDTEVDIKIFHAEIDILSQLKQLFPISCNVMKTHYTSLWTWFSEHRFIEIWRHLSHRSVRQCHAACDAVWLVTRYSCDVATMCPVVGGDHASLLAGHC